VIQFRDQEIENSQLVLDSPTEVCYLGHDLVLKSCTLVVKVPAKRLVIARTRMIGCTLEIKRELKNFHWDWVHLEGCRFKGRFIGNDFGSWPEALTEGSIRDCDFTEAHLEGCRFLQCELSTLRFPRWPYFTLLEVGSRAHELGRVPWPGAKGPLFGEILAEMTPAARAMTESAPELAKWCGTTPEAIKAVLEKLDGVYC
jgi:hypothetical protein